MSLILHIGSAGLVYEIIECSMLPFLCVVSGLRGEADGLPRAVDIFTRVIYSQIVTR